MKKALFLKDVKSKLGEDIGIIYKDILHEPYIQAGKGLLGALIENKNGELLCNECGKWIGGLAQHLRKHKMTAREYKIKYGLYQQTALISKKISSHMSKAATNKVNIDKMKRMARKAGRISYQKKTAYIHHKKTAQFRNDSNTCEAQVLVRLQVIVKESNHKSIAEITGQVIKKYDKSLYKFFERRYKTLKIASEIYGFKYGSKLLQPKILSFSPQQNRKIYLLSQIRIFIRKYKKIPSTRSWKHTHSSPSVTIYQEEFGSWNQTLAKAGAKQLLKEMQEGGEKQWKNKKNNI